MKVDASLPAEMLSIGRSAQKLEELGYDGLRVAELNHEPFMPLAIAASQTSRIELVTSVAVAFARNPMLLAVQAHDLNAFSGGRFVLGIGSQVKPHITRRFSMPWYKAARQMREFIEAMGAIFDCWYEGKKLDYEGEYYQHTLMPKTFTPQNVEFGRPKVLLSATGPLMTKVAAEIADGMIMHPFSTQKYMSEVSMPAIQQGLLKSARTLDDFIIDYAPMIATGTTEEELNKSISLVRDRIAFYGCTVAYRPVLEIHGWGELQDELITLNRQHKTKKMSELVTDEMVNTIAIVGEPAEVIDSMHKRMGGIVDRTGFGASSLAGHQITELLKKLRGMDA